MLLVTSIFELIFIFANPRTIYFVETILNQEKVAENQKERAFGRLYFWKNAYEIGMTNPLFGAGTGDMQRYLYKKYAEQNLVQFMSPAYNAHNQFLENFGQMGITGLFALLGILGYANNCGRSERGDCTYCPAYHRNYKRYLRLLLSLGWDV